MHDELMVSIAEKFLSKKGIVFPPLVFLEMDGEMLDYRAGVFLTVKFPVKKRYQNPFGFMQGGMIVAAVDNTIGPLSMLEAEASVTSQLNTTYIRPIGPEQGSIYITATIVAKTRRTLHIRADVKNEAGTLCVTCFASCVLMQTDGEMRP